MTANPRPEGDEYFTLDEAAERFNCCGKTLSRFLRDHPAYPPLFAKTGKKIIISEADLGRIYEAMKSCHSSSSVTLSARRISGSAVSISGSTWTEAQRRVAELRRGTPLPNGEKKSSVVPTPARQHSSEQPTAYRVADLARRWNCAPGTIYKLIRKAQLLAFDISGLVRISAKEVERIEAGGTDEPDAKALEPSPEKQPTRAVWPPPLVIRSPKGGVLNREAVAKL